MYFLVKNIRSCSKSFGKVPDKSKLYLKNGLLNWEYLARNLSFFVNHPEQIKQQLKEKDAHMLCQFFDSEEYKKRVSEFLETQGRILAKDTISGTKPSNSIKYQHVLSCAQPLTKKSKIFTEETTKLETKVPEDGSRKKRIRRGTIFEEMVKRRCRLEGKQEGDYYAFKTETKPKVVRQKSTIMPIFLKKIKQRLEEEERECDDEEADVEYQTAKRQKRLTAKECEPLYAQLLQKSPTKTYRPVQRQMSCSYILDNETPGVSVRPFTAGGSEPSSLIYPYKVITRQQPSTEKNPHTKPKTPQPDKPPSRMSIGRNILDTVEPPSNTNRNSGGYKLSGLDHYSLNKTSSKLETIPMKLGSPSNVVPLRMASSTAKLCSKMPRSKLYPKKKMNLKSFSEFLCVETVNPQRIRREKPARDTDDTGLKIKVLKRREHQKSDNDTTQKKEASMQRLVDEMQTKRSLKSLKFENKLEKKNTMMMVMKNKEKMKSKGKVKPEEMLSLFQKVKMGTSKSNASEPPLTPNKDKPTTLIAPKQTTPKQPTIESTPKLTKPKPNNSDHESFTYKVVAKNREWKDAKLRKKLRLNPSYWPYTCNYSEQSAKEAADLEEVSVRSGDYLNLEETRQRLGIISKNIPRNLHRPVPHFVEHANKAKTPGVGQYHAPPTYEPTYLIRLPKTTPEGYRVLLYAVRDPDPTKMNFNDVVKGFCMYNDCVLSEDGLQDGYVVIFDMKGVSIGHLARVSLPALKCFMWYIQDAHPCRIKQIHVLNTATWIHHVMRLVVPLVRSELLNLVKFHKGNLPEGLPTELLPMDYGGEAPTVEELDNTTKSLLGKYRDWLIESERLVADESKRVKKSGWWGLFSGKSSQQVELDEKTILKNLQID